jgi:hypothetical protein
MSDLRATLGILHRRTRVLVAAAIVGLAAGVAYVLVQPPALTSTALVLLPIPAVPESSSSDIDTQVQIAISATVLYRAGQKIEPALPVRSVRKLVEASAPTTQLIQIDATSTNAAVAQTLSQAVADSYVEYVNNTAREVSSAAQVDLKIRRDRLQAQIHQLEDEIASVKQRQRANSPDGRKEAQLLAALRTEQAHLSLQLDKVADKIDIGPAGSPDTLGTLVVQPATEPDGQSTWIRLVVWAPLGALICTIFAGVVLVGATWRDNRVRLRDEIADAVGSPVLAAVRSNPQQSVAGWSKLLKTYEAPPAESWAFRQVLRHLVATGGHAESSAALEVNHSQALTVLSLSGDQRGLAIGPQFAAFTSSLGITTHLVPAMGDESAAALWAACASERGSAARPGLYISDVSEGRKIGLTIDLVVVDPAKPDLGNTPESAVTILAIAPGTATEQELARVAIAVDDVGRRVDGVVVADPDQTDRTSGRHTMYERSRLPALPTRLTGNGLPHGSTQSRSRS